MDASVMDWVQAIFRWVHVVAGILWIGLLYFFNWINGSVMATLDAETKRKVIPELMPRALYWFRWGGGLYLADGYFVARHDLLYGRRAAAGGLNA